MSDDFLKVHGEMTIVYSRITETSKTRIDYIFSNSNSCIFFQYLPVQSLDHQIALPKYEMDIEIRKESIPAERYFNGWVFPKNLENDEDFVEQAKYIVQMIKQNSGTHDPSFNWLKLKTSLTHLAKVRQKQIENERNERLLIYKVFFL